MPVRTIAFVAARSGNFWRCGICSNWSVERLSRLAVGPPHTEASLSLGGAGARPDTDFTPKGC